MKRFLRVNMAEQSAVFTEVEKEYELFGGRSLIAKILTDEVEPTCDPLGGENKLIVCTGLMADTPAASSGRISIGGKSPLTGTIKEANAGGTFGKQLVSLGLKAVIVENKPVNDKWYILVLGEEEVEFIPAEKYLGMNNYELVEELRKEFGDKISVASIGCAGERGYRNSTLQITDPEGRPSRAAARGGLGAVMGSKGIKAFIIKEKGTFKGEMVDKESFTEKNRTYLKEIRENPISGKGMPALGTAVLVNVTNALGILPTRNYSKGRFEHVEDISGEHIAELQSKRKGVMKHACQPGCIIQCSQVYNDSKGKYLTSGFEYETIGLVGSNCAIDDIDIIARIDRMCDDLGIDTMETGGTLGVAMEAGAIPWGDGEAAVQLIQEMMDGTERGRILGNGTDAAGKYFGVERIPTTKGQTLAAYDPRGLKGTGVTYATSPMGADHTAGNVLGVPGDPADKEGKVELSRNMQVAMALIDTLGMCIFTSFVFEKPENIQVLADIVASKFGGEWDIERLMGLGAQALSLEKQFNRLAGFTDKDDRLPGFMYTEPLPETGNIFDIDEEELATTLPM